MSKAKQMVDDAAAAGAECVKFQCHVCEDEMSQQARKVVYTWVMTLGRDWNDIGILLISMLYRSIYLFTQSI